MMTTSNSNGVVMQNAKVEGQKCWTGIARLNWVNILEPYKFEGEQEAHYRTEVIISKQDTKTLECLQSAIDAAKAAYDGKDNKPFKLFMNDGDKKTDKNGVPDPLYAGCWYFNTKSKKQPNVRKLVNGVVKPVEPDDIYSGCFGQVVIYCYPYSFSGNKGISAGLNGFLKIDDGENLGGGGSNSDMSLWGTEVDNTLDDTAQQAPQATTAPAPATQQVPQSQGFSFM